VNEQGPYSRLNPGTPAVALTQQKNRWTQFLPIQSRLVVEDPRENAWNDAQADATNEDEWKAHI
jgi:hypothetical protein